MSIKLCPHCGKSREGMRDEQPCWNCHRLPGTAPQQAPAYQSRSSYAVPPPFDEFGYSAPPANGIDTKPYIPTWLVVTGTLGVLLMAGLCLGLVYLFLTAEDQPPGGETGETSVGVPTRVTSIASSPAVNGEATVDSGVSVGTPAVTVPAVDPIAETATAMQSSQPTMTPTMLPTPSPAPTMTLEAPTPIVCPDAPATRLSIDGQAAVLGNGVRMRDTPSLQGGVVLNINQGAVVDITGDPVCADGYLWWPVRTSGGGEGWAAEGSASGYFLEPR